MLSQSSSQLLQVSSIIFPALLLPTSAETLIVVLVISEIIEDSFLVDAEGEELIEGLFYPGEFLGLDCISFKAYTHFAETK